jgi:hypothetical protein
MSLIQQARYVVYPLVYGTAYQKHRLPKKFMTSEKLNDFSIYTYSFAYPLDEVSKLLNTLNFLRVLASHGHLLDGVLKEGSHLKLHLELLLLLGIL